MTEATAIAAPGATRLPANLRRAILLGVRSTRSRRIADETGVYTARNQPRVLVVHFGTPELERAVDQLSELEHRYWLAGYSAASRNGRGDSRRMQRIRRYSRMLREAAIYGDDTRRLRLWLRTNLLRVKLTDRDRAEAAEAAGRA